MKEFASFLKEIKALLEVIVQSEVLHSKWLNTLSYLENCGARKIALCEHPTMVKEEMLKHAAEEFRHAHYLKRQIKRVSSNQMNNYCMTNMLGTVSSLNYLNRLNIYTSRYLKKLGYSTADIKEYAYLLVTYAIELRAAELYPAYDEILKKNDSPVTVKSILLEEKQHLREMEEGLQQIENGGELASAICRIESTLCQKWLFAILKQLGNEAKPLKKNILHT